LQPLNKLKSKKMIIIPIKEGENIERALKRYKKKFERTGALKELRRRKQFDRPSVINREARQKAIYIEQLRKAEE